MRKLVVILILLPLLASSQLPIPAQVGFNRPYSVAPPFSCEDADAAAWIAASGISDTTGICQFFKALKDSSLWDKIQAAGITVGTTADQVKFNVKNPLNSDAAFRLTFSGTWNYSSSGMSETGSGYADTKYNPSDSANLDDNHIAVYTTAGSENTMMGAAPFGTFQDGIYLFVNSGTWYVKNYGTGSSSESPTPAASGYSGFFVNNRVSSTSYSVFKNNVASYATNTTNLRTANNIWLNAMNQGGVSYPGDYTISFWSIGRGLTPDQLRAYNNIVEQLMDARGIGVQ